MGERESLKRAGVRSVGSPGRSPILETDHFTPRSLDGRGRGRTHLVGVLEGAIVAQEVISRLNLVTFILSELEMAGAFCFS